MITIVLLLPLLTQPLLVFFLCNTWVQTMHLHYQLLKSIILSYTKLPPEDSCRSQHVDLLGLYHSISLILSWCFLPSTSLLYQLHQQPQGSLRFSVICHVLCISSSKVFVLAFLFDFLQCGVVLSTQWWNCTVTSISLICRLNSLNLVCFLLWVLSVFSGLF